MVPRVTRIGCTPSDRDQQAGDQADDRRTAPSRQRGRRAASRRAPPRRVRRHQRGQDPGHQQSRQVRGGDDREVDAAGDQRDRHRQRQQAELGQLEHHRLQRRPAREGRRLDQREEATSSASRASRPPRPTGAAAHPADQPIGVAGEGRRLCVGNGVAPSTRPRHVRSPRRFSA